MLAGGKNQSKAARREPELSQAHSYRLGPEPVRSVDGIQGLSSGPIGSGNSVPSLPQLSSSTISLDGVSVSHRDLLSSHMYLGMDSSVPTSTQSLDESSYLRRDIQGTPLIRNQPARVEDRFQFEGQIPFTSTFHSGQDVDESGLIDNVLWN